MTRLKHGTLRSLFILDGRRRSAAAVAPVKYERNAMNLTHEYGSGLERVAVLLSGFAIN